MDLLVRLYLDLLKLDLYQTSIKYSGILIWGVHEDSQPSLRAISDHIKK